MSLDLAQKVDIYYNKPLDLGSIMSEFIGEYIKSIVVFYDDYFEKFKELGATPIVKNEKYPFYVVDYGYLIWCLIKVLKSYGVSDKKLQLIEKQFTLKSDSFMANGKFFVSILEYYGIAFRQKVSGTFFYVRNLYLDEYSDTFFALNSVAINGHIFDKYLNTNYVTNLLDEVGYFKPKIMAYGGNVESQLKLLKSQKKETQKIVVFSSPVGINGDILEF